MIHRFIALFLYLMALFSLLFVVYAFVGLLALKDTNASIQTLVTIFMAFGLLTFVTGRSAGKHRQQAKHQQHEKLEKQILHVIAQHGGRTTPEEIAMLTKLTVQQSVEYLDTLCQQGSGGKELTEQGKVIYVFNGFVSEEDKRTAKSVS